MGATKYTSDEGDIDPASHRVREGCGTPWFEGKAIGEPEAVRRSQGRSLGSEEKQQDAPKPTEKNEKRLGIQQKLENEKKRQQGEEKNTQAIRNHCKQNLTAQTTTQNNLRMNLKKVAETLHTMEWKFNKKDK
eukprot:Gb_34466 [translate_table: standard]